MSKNKNLKGNKRIDKVMNIIDKNNKEADNIIAKNDLTKIIGKCKKDLKKDLENMEFKMVDI